MGLSYPSSYGNRNPFAPTNLPRQNEPSPAAAHYGAYNMMPGRASGSSDYQRMLHQHLSTTDGGGGGGVSIQQHSLLDEHPPMAHHIYNTNAHMRNIERGTDPTSTSNYFTRNSQSVLGESMGASVCRGLRKKEGPSTGPIEGVVLNSLYNSADAIANGVHPSDLTTVDMCLSTLYMHELHQRKIKRHGLPVDYSQNESTLHPSEQHLSSHSGGNSGGGGGSSAHLPSSAVEKTPLLGAKKS